MTTGYVDGDLIQNSSLSCFLLTSFVQMYEARTANTESPELLKLLLVLPVVWHRDSRDAIKSRIFSTPLHAVLSDCPLIKSHFQQRMAAFTAVSLQGVNLACATGLLKKTDFNNRPSIATTFKAWPKGSKPVSVPKDMLRTTDRLATWFKDIPTAQLYKYFLEA